MFFKNSSKCDDCLEFLSPDKVPFHPDIDEVVNTDQVEAREEFVRNLTRGGLIKPSDALFVLCVHVSMYTFIINAENHKKVLLPISTTTLTCLNVPLTILTNYTKLGLY